MLQRLSLPGRPSEGAAAFSKADEGKIVEIKNGKVKVNGANRDVRWGDSTQMDCTATIVKVESGLNGKVELSNGRSALYRHM